MNKGTNLIFLCGFMGSGKTTVGKRLAEYLGYAFVDTDHEIEKKENKSVREIFEKKGEGYFRQCERDVITGLVPSQTKTVVALGGGLLMDQKNLELVCQSGYLIYLKTDLSTVTERLKYDTARPLFKANELETLFDMRRPGYEKALWTVETEGLSAAVIAEKIRVKLISINLV
jgi:shikimate kinase